MKDAYAQAVEYLTENPDAIGLAWLDGGFITTNSTYEGEVSKGACLFSICGNGSCGCLTMIRGSLREQAATPKLEAAIRADARLPDDEQNITPDHLPIFAGWQRRIDQELGRTPPPLDPRLPAPKGDIEIPAIEYGIHGGTIAKDSTPDDLGELAGRHTVGGGK